MKSATRTFSTALIVVLGLVACSDGGSYRSPSAPDPHPSGPQASIWLASVSVLTVSPGACFSSSDSSPRENVHLSIIRADERIQIFGMLDEGQYGPPIYEGTLWESHFTASTWDDGGPGCFLWGGTLEGDFTADELWFEARETLEYRYPEGPPQLVTRRWTGARR